MRALASFSVAAAVDDAFVLVAAAVFLSMAADALLCRVRSAAAEADGDDNGERSAIADIGPVTEWDGATSEEDDGRDDSTLEESCDDVTNEELVDSDADVVLVAVVEVVVDDWPLTEVSAEPCASNIGAAPPSPATAASSTMSTGTDGVDTGDELADVTTDVSIGVTGPGAVGAFKFRSPFALLLISLGAFSDVTESIELLVCLSA